MATTTRLPAAMAYYSSVFPEAEVRAWLKRLRLESRPISGVSTTSYWKKFKGLDDVLQAARDGDIVEMHVSLGPDADGKFGCFFLDFDINECLPRACCGTEKHLCDVCLPVVTAWGLHLKQVVGHVLRVCVDDVVCVLSGGKGIHLWAPLPFQVYRAVRDSYYDRFSRRTWTDDLMYEIAQFMYSIPLPFLRHALFSYGSSVFQLAVRQALTHAALITTVHEYRRRVYSHESLLDTVNFIYTTAFPLSYDENVVKSETHNLRLPLSVNYTSGSLNANKIVVPVKSVEDFPRLECIPTVENLDHSNISFIKDALQPGQS